MRLRPELALLSVCLAAGAGHAADLTLDDALTRIERDDVRVLRAEEATSDADGRVFRFRVIGTGGRMYTLEVDAATGEMREVATGPMVLPRGAPPANESDNAATPTAGQDPCAS